VPDLPPMFLQRPEDLATLKDKVLAVGQSVVMTGSSTGGVAVQGMGGIGKSVLAAAIAHTPEVRQAFPDGIFWLTIGQESKLVELQTDLARAVGLEPGFSTVQQGKADLKQHLAHKTCLLILDDIWNVADLAALDVVGRSGQLLVTTRDARMGASIGATDYRLDVLSQSQARQLLAQWTQWDAACLPREADAIAQECGYLPLALAMAGAMLRGKGGDRWGNILHKLQNADLAKIRQQFPEYPYPNLLKALQVSVNALEPEQRERYLDFAIFPEDTPIPEAVLQTFWEPEGLDEYDSQDIIDALADLSLLRQDEAGRVTLHDLQMDYVRKQAGADMAALHQRLLDAYDETCSDGWSSLPEDGYSYEWLPWHLREAGNIQELRTLLLDFRWLRAKLNATTVNALLGDYGLLPGDAALKLVANSLRLSAHVLVKSKHQLASRLRGHLLGQPSASIQQLLAQTQLHAQSSWLCPLSATLTAPDGALLRTLEGHKGVVFSVVVSADFSQAISASDDCTLKLWNLHTGEVLQTLEGHSASVYAVKVSADFSLAISASQDRTLKVWDLHTGQILNNLTGYGGKISSFLKVSSDFSRAIAASDDQTLKLWNLHTGEVLQTLEDHGLVTVSADFNQAISVRFGNILDIRDLHTGAILRTFHGDRFNINFGRIAISDDCSRAIACSLDDYSLKVWDLHTGEVLRILEGHDTEVVTIKVSADFSRAISIASDQTFIMWNLHTGQVLEAGELGDRNCSHFLATSEDFSRAISDSNDSLRIWNLHTGQVLKTLEGHSGMIRSVGVSKDFRKAISASDDYTLKVWDLDVNKEGQTQLGRSGQVSSLAIAEDSDRALSASLIFSSEGILNVWDLHTGKVTQTLKEKGGIRSVLAAADLSRAIITFRYDPPKMWNFLTGRAMRFPRQKGDATGNLVGVSPDFSQALFSFSWNVFKVWDLQTGEVQQVLKETSENTQYQAPIAVSADFSRAISCRYNHEAELVRVRYQPTLVVWDLHTGETLQTLAGERLTTSSIVTSKDFSRALFTLRNRTLQVWDLCTGKMLQTLEGHDGGIESVGVTGDFTRAVSASRDHTLRLWDLQNGKLIASFEGDRPFTACAITPDGTHVVAGDSGGGVHFFKIEEPGGDFGF